MEVKWETRELLPLVKMAEKYERISVHLNFCFNLRVALFFNALTQKEIASMGLS